MVEIDEIIEMSRVQESLSLSESQKKDLISQMIDPTSDTLITMIRAGIIPLASDVFTSYRRGGDPVTALKMVELSPAIPISTDTLTQDGKIRLTTFAIGETDNGRVYQSQIRSGMLRGFALSEASDVRDAYLGIGTVLGTVSIDQWDGIVEIVSSELISMSNELFLNN